MSCIKSAGKVTLKFILLDASINPLFIHPILLSKYPTTITTKTGTVAFKL